MDFSLSPELKMIRQMVSDFVAERLQPLVMQVEEEDRIPPEIIEEMAELGFFGLPFPEEYGGAGLGELGYVMAMEEMGAVNAAYGNIIGAHTGIGAMAIYLDGTEEQRNKYMPGLCSGENIAAFALTEPGAGSDAAAIQTTAVKQGTNYILNGRKQWITNGNIAGIIIVFAVTDKSLGARGGVSAFIVENTYKGLSIGKIDEKMGLRGSHTCEVVLEDCVVPEENVLGDVGLGFVTAMKTLDCGRVGLAGGAVGSSQYLLELCIDWAKQRVQFGKPIGENQAIQWMLADMATEIHAARLMTYHAAWKLDQGEKVSREAAMVKLYASEVANRIADKAVQIHGGMGYMKEHVVERYYRDARILPIYEGTNEIQRLVIARDLLRKGK